MGNAVIDTRIFPAQAADPLVRPGLWRGLGAGSGLAAWRVAAVELAAGLAEPSEGELAGLGSRRPFGRSRSTSCRCQSLPSACRLREDVLICCAIRETTSHIVIIVKVLDLNRRDMAKLEHVVAGLRSGLVHTFRTEDPQ